MGKTNLFNKSFLLLSWFEHLSICHVFLKNERWCVCACVCVQSSVLLEGVGLAVGW